jgi:hypothetical protein
LKTSARFSRLERLAAKKLRRPPIPAATYSELWEAISEEQLDRAIAELREGRQPSDPDVVAAALEDLAGPLRWIGEMDAQELETLNANLETINAHLEKKR